VKTTGQDASLKGVQNVLLGYQGATLFKDFRLQAPEADIVAAILQSKKPRTRMATVNNGQVDVPSVMLPVVPIDQGNIKQLVTNGWIGSQLGGIDKVMTGLPESARTYLQ